MQHYFNLMDPSKEEQTGDYLVDRFQRGMWTNEDLKIWEKLTHVKEKNLLTNFKPNNPSVGIAKIKFEYTRCNHVIKDILTLVRQKLERIRKTENVEDILDLETFAYIDNPHNTEYVRSIIDLVERQLDKMEFDIDRPMSLVVKCNIDKNGFLNV